MEKKMRSRSRSESDLIIDIIKTPKLRIPKTLTEHELHSQAAAEVRNGGLDDSESDDKYQVFKVCRDRCQRLFVTIERGRGITRGKIKDWLYRPDPYVSVQVIGTPNGQKRTKHISSCSDPIWDETFAFYVDVQRDRFVEFVLCDLNRTVNEEIGREILDIDKFLPDVEHHVIISYKNGSKVDIKIKIETNWRTDLRFSLDLCPEEEEFLKDRKRKVSQGLKKLLKLNEDLDELSQNEIPTICVMTSGGGFRAMIAYAGVFRALVKLGLIDCTTYLSALSGSSWYLATLFSHQDFSHAEDHVAVDKIIPEIRMCVEKHWQVHLSPPWSSRYIRKIIGKSVNGQPVSFTDFYGFLVGQQLLKGRMKARLSHQRDKIEYGRAPMPIYTCLHVKSNVSAKVFQEWYEFTPYEVGVPKYGAFMKTPDFASKFYVGQVVKSFPEVPLHFLYGVWGSAFTILFKRLVQEKGRNGQNEILKMIMGAAKETDHKEEEEEELIVRCLAEECRLPSRSPIDLDQEEIIFDADVDELDDNQTEAQNLGASPPLFAPLSPTSACLNNTDSGNSSMSPDYQSGGSEETQFNFAVSPSSDETLDEMGTSPPSEKQVKKLSLRQRFRQYSLPKIRRKAVSIDLKSPSDQYLEVPSAAKSSNKLSPVSTNERITQLEEERSRFDRVLEKALMNTPLDSRAFRAGVILNPLRGLTVLPNKKEAAAAAAKHGSSSFSSPVKPTDVGEYSDFKGYRESMKTDDKKIYLVDSGLSFNLPFPLMLRPQRNIQLYIAFDFSSRQSDSTPPFRELLLAEKWARLHRLPFPPVRDAVKGLLDAPVRECYVFKDPDDDPKVPVILFFPLVNADFRRMKSPGEPRCTEEEKSFGDFNIFDDTNAYAIWRFVYPNLSFDRLTAMMEFNVMNNAEVITAEIGHLLNRRT